MGDIRTIDWVILATGVSCLVLALWLQGIFAWAQRTFTPGWVPLAKAFEDGLAKAFGERSETRNEGPAIWPVRDLFCYLNPALNTASPANKLWLATGQAVKDALSLGRLTCWGRPPSTDWIAKMVGDESDDRPAPKRIDPDYWHHAKFSYAFITDRHAVHTYPDEGSGLPEYRDLTVNEARAKIVWPRPHSNMRHERTVTREGLAALIAEASSILDACRDTDAKPPNREVGEWKEKVERYLTERLDGSYVARFNNIPEFDMAALPLGSPWHPVLEAGIRARIKRLNDFIEELI